MRSPSHRLVAGSTALALLAAASLASACSQGRAESPPAPRDDELAEPALTGQEGDDPPDPASAAPPATGAAGPALLTEVEREMRSMKASTYRHRTHVDEATGTFDYDCSGLLRYALGRTAPDALAEVKAAAARRPRSSEFVAFLLGIPAGGQQGRWQRVARVRDLVPGDVIVWLKTAESRSTNTGHTMIVHGTPTPEPTRVDAFIVPIVDATEHPHVPGDARADTHQTGLGQGEIVLLADSAGAPVGYRWSRGRKSREKATTIALGRLR